MGKVLIIIGIVALCIGIAGLILSITVGEKMMRKAVNKIINEV